MWSKAIKSIINLVLTSRIDFVKFTEVIITRIKPLCKYEFSLHSLSKLTNYKKHANNKIIIIIIIIISWHYGPSGTRTC